MIALLLKTPVGLDFDALPDEVQEIITGLSAIYPAAQMPGTVEVGGQCILYAVLRSSITLEQLEGLIAAHSLPWEVVDMRTVQADTPAEYNDEGLLLAPARAAIYKEMDPAIIGPFIAPDYDIDGNATPKTGTVKLSQYSIRGAIPWSVEL